MTATTASDDLRLVVAGWATGGLVNALDEIVKHHGTDAVPPSAQLAGVALAALIADLGVTDGRHPLAAEVWRVAP